MGCSPWGRKELDTPEHAAHTSPSATDPDSSSGRVQSQAQALEPQIRVHI